MKIVKLFEEFINEGIVRKMSPDKQRAESLLLESKKN